MFTQVVVAGIMVYFLRHHDRERLLTDLIHRDVRANLIKYLPLVYSHFEWNEFFYGFVAHSDKPIHDLQTRRDLQLVIFCFKSNQTVIRIIWRFRLAADALRRTSVVWLMFSVFSCYQSYTCRYIEIISKHVNNTVISINVI